MFQIFYSFSNMFGFVRCAVFIRFFWQTQLHPFCPQDSFRAKNYLQLPQLAEQESRTVSNLETMSVCRPLSSANFLITCWRATNANTEQLLWHFIISSHLALLGFMMQNGWLSAFIKVAHHSVKNFSQKVSFWKTKQARTKYRFIDKVENNQCK